MSLICGRRSVALGDMQCLHPGTPGQGELHHGQNSTYFRHICRWPQMALPPQHCPSLYCIPYAHLLSIHECTRHRRCCQAMLCKSQLHLAVHLLLQMPMASQQTASIRLDSPEDSPHKHASSNVAQSSLHDCQPKAQRERVAKVEGGLRRTKRSCSQQQQPASGDCYGVKLHSNAFAEQTCHCPAVSGVRNTEAVLCTLKLPRVRQSL